MTSTPVASPVGETLSADRDRLIHILVVHYDMFRHKAEEAADLFLHDKTLASPPSPAQVTDGWPEGPFNFGDRVEKTKGSSWRGSICGWYSTSLTPLGYSVESEREPGSVQLYPVAALQPKGE